VVITGAWEYELPGSSTRPTSVEEGEALYRAALTALGEGVIIQDADSTIVAANAAAPRILGLTMDQLLGRTSLDPGWRVVHRDGSPFPGDTHSCRWRCASTVRSSHHASDWARRSSCMASSPSALPVSRNALFER